MPICVGRSNATESPVCPAQQVAIARIRLRRRAESGILPHGPQSPAIHRGINAARKGKFAGKAQLALEFPIARSSRVESTGMGRPVVVAALLLFQFRIFANRRLLGVVGHQRTRRALRNEVNEKIAMINE